MTTIPLWLQILVAIATPMATIVYIIQLYVTRKQFKKQVKISEESQALNAMQFKLLNQGYLSIDLHPQLLTDLLPPNSPLVPGQTYNGISLKAITINVGNTPVVAIIKSAIIYFNGVERYNSHLQTLTKNAIYPKQSIELTLGAVSFTGANVYHDIAYIQSLNLTCKFIIEYNDINDTKTKFINRTIQLLPTDYGFMGSYLLVEDSI